MTSDASRDAPPQGTRKASEQSATSSPRKPDAPLHWRPPARPLPVTAAIAALIVTAVGTITYAWQLPPFAGVFEQTDDASVRGQTTVISSQVSGYVVQVPVNDFQHVQRNAVLVRIEDSIYKARVAQAQANVLVEQADLDNSTQAQRSRLADTLAQDAAIANAQAQLVKADADLERTSALFADGWTTAAVRDEQIAAVRAAGAQLEQARAARQIGTEDVRSVIVARNGLVANVKAAQAQVRLAQVDLQHTIVRAPWAGRLGEVGVRQGQYVTAGTQLMFLVPRALWVIANFKEAQTRNMRVGQKASFTVDALGGRRFRGRLESIAPAAGSEFAVLRADNATGNFVKVAQRIAVRVRIDPSQSMADRLRPGMSVVARIRTGH